MEDSIDTNDLYTIEDAGCQCYPGTVFTSIDTAIAFLKEEYADPDLDVNRFDIITLYDSLSTLM